MKGKTCFKYPNKYYCTDIGLRNARLNYRQYNPGHIMENIICNELLRRGYSVDIGVVTDRTGGANMQKEIDFVVNDADTRIYIQSAFRMDTDKKEFSELASLMPAKDFFKKIIVRMDIPHSFHDNNGIFHCSLTDLLLGRAKLFQPANRADTVNTIPFGTAHCILASFVSQFSGKIARFNAAKGGRKAALFMLCYITCSSNSSLIRASTLFSILDTCTCDTPMAFAVCSCVMSLKYLKTITCLSLSGRLPIIPLS